MHKSVNFAADISLTLSFPIASSAGYLASWSMGPMAKEQREITFKNSEVVDALYIFCEKTDRQLPQQGNNTLTFNNDPQVSINLSHDDTAQSSSTFLQNEAAAALILYCKGKGIPVPKRASKWIEVKQNSLALVMTMTT